MKRQLHLFEAVASFENLLLASRKARLGKRFQSAVAEFDMEIESNLLALRRELLGGTYMPGPYRSFWITDPKPRLISAAPYRDRVVHHALCNVIEPIFEGGFIFDSYACRRGKGTHAAIERFGHFARANPYVLQCDVQKYFPSIDHALLLRAIGRKIGCRRTLELIALIVANSNEQEPVRHCFAGDDLFTPAERRHGIPIGNLTSQFFANIVLDPLDHYVKEVLRQPCYLRYVDDLAVFGRGKRELWAAKRDIESFAEGLRLRLHPRKCQVSATRDGAPFLGFRVFPTHRTPLKPKARQYLRHVRALRDQYEAGLVPLEKVRESVQSWIGHVGFGASYRLRRSVLAQVVFVGGGLRRSRSSRRLVEQQSEELPLREPKQEQPEERVEQQRFPGLPARLPAV